MNTILLRRFAIAFLSLLTSTMLWAEDGDIFTVKNS